MEKINELSDHLKQYIDNRITAIKLQLANKASSMIASSVTFLCIGALVTISIILLSIGAAILINEALESSYAGYVITALFYLLLAIAVRLSSEQLIRIPILNRFIQQLFDDEKNK